MVIYRLALINQDKVMMMQDQRRMDDFGYDKSVIVEAETWKAIGREFFGEDREKWRTLVKC